VSAYDAGQAPAGPRGVPALLIARRLTMAGFVVLDDPLRREAAEVALAAWVDDATLQAPVQVVQGLENAPQALIDLLAGGNTGKMMVRLD
jgi:NADPH-dependent curcumin reductase CurA